LVLLQVTPRPADGSVQSQAAGAAIRGLALIPLSRVVALGLPLRDGSDAAGLLVVALLVGFVALALAPAVGVIRRTLFAARLPLPHLRAALAGLVLGLAAYLLGAPVLWPAGAAGDRVLLGLVAAACAAGVEELVFRGIVQVTLQRALGRVGVLAGSALFASTYLGAGAAPLVLALALAGLVFAHTVARTGTLGGPIAGHVLLALGAGGIWPALLGRAHPSWLSQPGSTIGLAVAVVGMTAILLHRPVERVAARARRS
jgi:membrane protease YdiL (CAAX protease family)